MIYLDDRIGSGELLPLFKPYGVSVSRERMEFGDMAWEGWGPRGKCMVGVERKRIDDLLQSIHTKRLSGHQLPGMVDHYDYGYLVVEGLWKASESGELLVREGDWDRGRWVGRGVPTRAVHNYLMGLSLRAGLIAWRTTCERETVEFVVDQYRMWTEKRWEEHKAHEAVYVGKGAFQAVDGGRGHRLNLQVRKAGPVELVALMVPGLGEKLAYRVGKKFGSVLAMACASEERWGEIKGISRQGAVRIRKWLTGAD